MVMKEIFDRLIIEGLSPNSFYILHCIHNKITPNKLVSSSLEVTKLKVGGYLKENLELTNNSLNFIQEVESYFKKSKKKTSSILMGDEFLSKITIYNEIFPNKKLSSGKYARVNVKTLENSFRWFFDNYAYSWETILKATDKYVDEYSVRRYEYMRTSQYFVRKQNTDKTWDSELATYCDLIENGYDEETNYFKETVV
jgi:hypothetical protein